MVRDDRIRDLPRGDTSLRRPSVSRGGRLRPGGAAADDRTAGDRPARVRPAGLRARADDDFLAIETILRRDGGGRVHRRAARSCPASSRRRPTCTPGSAASCRRSPPRAHLRNLLPVIDEALPRAGITLDGRRLRRRPQHAGAGRGAARRASARRRCSPWRSGVPLVGVNHVARPHLRLPAGRRARHLPVRRAGRQRRAHGPVPLRHRAVTDAARRHPRRRGRRGVRQGGGDPRARLPRRPGRRARGGRPATRRRSPSRARSSTTTGWSSASAG